MSRKKVRVLVVEDSSTLRSYLTGVLSASPDFEVAAEAADGREAIRLCEALRPDVVTMDIVLPVMSGVAATEYIMAWCPTPILIVSASVNRGQALKTYDALAAGAVDVVDKFSMDEPREQWEARFLSSLRMVSRIRVITHPRGRLKASRLAAGTEANRPAPLLAPPPASTGAAAMPGLTTNGAVRAVAIGASTGGPAAVADILRTLPAQYPVPILLVIHVSEQFAFALAEWLNTQSKVRVGFPADRQTLPPVGQPGVILAPAGSHLVLEGNLLRLKKTPERHSCRPSVDELFESVAAGLGRSSACILLTGMGRDGAAGLLAARRAGAATIAQDEPTSIVFGMPGEAIRMNAASRILPLDQIAPAILALGADGVRVNGGSL